MEIETWGVMAVEVPWGFTVGDVTAVEVPGRVTVGDVIVEVPGGFTVAETPGDVMAVEIALGGIVAVEVAWGVMIVDVPGGVMALNVTTDEASPSNVPTGQSGSTLGNSSAREVGLSAVVRV